MIFTIITNELSLEVLELEMETGFPSFKTLVEFKVDSAIYSHFKYSNIWFELNSIRNFKTALSNLLEREGKQHAKLIDLSSEIEIDFSTSEKDLKAFIRVEIKKRWPDYQLHFYNEIDKDIINVIIRQLNEFIREQPF